MGMADLNCDRGVRPRHLVTTETDGELMHPIQKIYIGFLLTLAVVFAAIAVPTVAKADNYPWYNCNIQFETTYKAYYYGAGGYWVAAANWLQYDDEYSEACNDINVQLWNTGNVEVRTQVCPSVGSCYSMGWGSLIQGSVEYGVTLHSYHMPCNGGCAFQFRIETRHWSDPGSGVAENLRMAT